MIKGKTLAQHASHSCLIPVHPKMGENIISVVVNTSTNPCCYGSHTERLLMFHSHFHSTASICICLISSSSVQRNNRDTNKLRSILPGRDYLSPYSSCLNFENTASSYSLLFPYPPPTALTVKTTVCCMPVHVFVKHQSYTTANEEFV